jgi:hypothetical protein
MVTNYVPKIATAKPSPKRNSPLFVSSKHLIWPHNPPRTSPLPLPHPCAAPRQPLGRFPEEAFHRPPSPTSFPTSELWNSHLAHDRRRRKITATAAKPCSRPDMPAPGSNAEETENTMGTGCSWRTSTAAAHAGGFPDTTAGSPRPPSWSARSLTSRMPAPITSKPLRGARSVPYLSNTSLMRLSRLLAAWSLLADQPAVVRPFLGLRGTDEGNHRLLPQAELLVLVLLLRGEESELGTQDGFNVFFKGEFGSNFWPLLVTTVGGARQSAR